VPTEPNKRAFVNLDENRVKTSYDAALEDSIRQDKAQLKE